MDNAPDAEPEASPYIRLPWALVAAGLGGVLLIALAVGLFANRYLRPQVGVIPTSTALPLAAAAAPTSAPVATLTPAPTDAATPIALVLATPAGSTATQTSPTAVPATTESASVAASPTSVVTPRATVSPELATEIGNAYQEYWRVRAEALYSLDTSRLQDVMAGDHLAAAEELIAQLRSEGRAIQTDVTHNYTIVRATSDEAEIADEYTDDSFYVDMNSRNHYPVG